MPAISAGNLRSTLAIAATLGAIAKVYWILARRMTFSPMSLDEIHFIWEGWALNRGMVPYRDFADFKPPIIFVCHALALKFLGLDHQLYRYFFSYLVATSLIGVAIALMSRKVNKGVILALMLVVFSLWLDPAYHDRSVDDAESIGLSFYMLGVASLILESRFKRWTDFAGGILLSLAVLSKEPFALSVLPTWMAFLSMRFTEAGGWQNVRHCAKRTLAGVAVVAVAMLGYMTAKGCLGEYIALLQSYLPFSQRICAEYGVWRPGPFLYEWQVRWITLTTHLVNVERLGIAIPLLLAPLVLNRREHLLTVMFGAATVLGGLYAVTLGGCFFGHYYVLAMPGLFFFMILGALRLSSVFNRLRPRVGLYVGLIFVLIPLSMLWQRIDRERHTKYVRGGPSVSADLVKFVQEHSGPDDTIFTTGWPGIYVHGERRHAVREGVYFDAFLSLYSGNTDEERVAPLYAQLVKNRPKIIIIEPHLAEKRVRHEKALWMPFINAFSYQKVSDALYVRPD